VTLVEECFYTHTLVVVLNIAAARQGFGSGKLLVAIIFTAINHFTSIFFFDTTSKLIL
jgi:hypothetical protein